MLNGFRIVAHVRRIQFLLNALLEVGISRLNNSRFHWVITQTNPLKTEYRQETYHFPETANLGRGGTFAPVDQITPLVEIEPQEYHTGQIVLNSQGMALQIPANLELLLDRFFSSGSADQDRFLRACFWFSFARSAAAESGSAAFTALISAIESLITQEQPNGQCPVCKRALGKGSTRRLVDFLNEFAPATPRFQEARAKLSYEFRSRLSHRGELSFLDRTGHFLGLTPVAPQERALQREVRGLVKIVLVNWLHSRSALLVRVDRG